VIEHGEAPEGELTRVFTQAWKRPPRHHLRGCA
jgi:hypothetical protein